ncbi:acylphosphatase [candidate division WWE3 bacterium CG08_land_8_20_14_0_20_43_13]|uniref:acylphosphatase n=1 Tax=candidate division WWE3 bacterium CG08_land_8_20_14_0_20_43_13 TaxID=1975087 RepID=A0A2H0X9Q0_UNCKA|nr:MAG: acylphosphatase [candidate division WWE3 bacterium CG08_land_8_20_14_0_20_43_13]
MTIHYLITGRVQGVGFRWWTKRQAPRYNIRGWVKNSPLDQVEILAQGKDTDLAKFEQQLKIGPYMAVVDTIEKEELANHVIYQDFYIET